MKQILITKDWLKENAKKISKIHITEYGKGYVRWIEDEMIDFMVEGDDTGLSYHIVTFDYILEHRDDVTIYLEEGYVFI